ncbi:hypothetical protein SB5_03975 [Pseudomonas oryzihabitans]|nr:hypothetical protein SB5_03975 [Pseudomonas psychrotolerans]
MAVTATQVQNLYLAYFGRPAEQAGLSYWTSQTSATVDQISASFAQQSEYTATYGSLTRAQTINQLYINLFNRSAASNELNYWLNSTDVTVDKLALALTNGATGSDRLTLDSKIQFASTATTDIGSSVDAVKAVVTNINNGTTTVAYNGGTYTLSQFTSGTNPIGSVGQFYQLANTNLSNQFTFTADTAFHNGNGTAVASTGAVFAANTVTGNVALSGATGSLTIAAADNQSALTGLTLTGTTGTAANTTAAATTLTLDEVGSVDAITTLTLNISNAATAASANNIVIGANTLGALTTINASGSSAALTIDATNVASTLTSLTGGSGNDSLTVAAAAKALTVNAGAGDDTITLSTVTTNANATVNHVTSVTLGSGNDTLNVSSLTNLVGTFNLSTQSGLSDANAAVANDLIKITDFASGDKIVLGTNVGAIQALTTAQAQTVAASATLADAANAAAQALGSSHTAAVSTTFVFNGNTYIFNDGATGAGSLTANDGLIELTGYTGTLTSANFTHA